MNSPLGIKRICRIGGNRFCNIFIRSNIHWVPDKYNQCYAFYKFNMYKYIHYDIILPSFAKHTIQLKPGIRI